MSLNLYNILQKVLNEAVDKDSIQQCIVNHNYVDITYSDEDNNAPGQRLIQPYAYGVSVANNMLIRAFQVSGDSLRGKPKWKTFRVDRITSWNPRRQTFNNPPPMQGYNAPDYNSNGDETMSRVILQADFGSYDTLDVLRRNRQNVSDAPKIASKNTSGPVAAHQQWKKNVYTSQPNSKKYADIARNIDITQNDFNRFDDDIWAKAEAERQQQEKEQDIQNTVKAPDVSQQGAIDTNVTDIKKQKNNGK